MGHVIYKSRCSCNATAFWSERHDSAVFHRHLPLILSRDRISGRCILYSFECVSQCSCLWYEQNKKSFWIMYTIVSKFTLCIPIKTTAKIILFLFLQFSWCFDLDRFGPTSTSVEYNSWSQTKVTDFVYRTNRNKWILKFGFWKDNLIHVLAWPYLYPQWLS